MNVYDIFGSGRKPAVTESKIEVVHEYVNEDFSGLMFGANNEDIAGPGGSDNNDSTSPIHGFGEDYDNIPDLENVGEQVVSIMDAERRLAQGDRIFAFHEMDEEPSEIHDVGQLAGYDAEQLLAVPQGVAEGTLNEFAPAGGGGSGDYFQALASAWYNGVFNTGSLPKGIKTQEDVERLLNRGIVCPDGKTRKLHIDYNSDFDGVEIYSDDYYEHGDYDDTIDSRTGQKWGPYDFMAFSDEDLSEGVAEGGAETSWSNDTGTITLQDILELTKHIKQINLPINDNLKSKLLHWEGNPEEIERVNQVTVSNQFPILIMIDEQGQIAWILDGNHRLHKAIQSQAKTIPAKLIKPSNLNDKAKKIFNIKEQGVAEAPHDDEVDYDDKYQAMVKRVGQKAREQQRHEPVDLVKLAQRLRQADKTTDTTDEDVMESRLSAMKRAGYDIL